ncbi:MAG: RNA 2',3'-cyclic phosphodiesterase [Candidatus Aenigmarchaeota archaeon]|nr:RNA 2',3'-cyclic phosphodiesterase [Candidatus Aenigmarchaeota archaeon]MBU5689169.1 RNA 2',3'-cyclic phosphodiesterase [Candidatus Aenigmarchaeota archaeon]
MVRLFVCIWIPEELKRDIIKFQEKMSKLPMDAKFVEKENLHLTITFLGEVEDTSSIKNSLVNIKGFGSFPITLSGLKIIPSENYIRVVGIEVKDKGKLSLLIKTVGGMIGGDYYENSKMTLCRVKSIKNKDEVLDFLRKNKDVNFGEFMAKKISLVRSDLTPHGPIYTTIFEVDLE